MNRNPNCEGITRYWKTGEDDRVELRRLTGVSRGTVDLLMSSLWELLTSKRRTKFVGIGVFEWRPCRRRLPTGRVVETWRLAFKPSRYAERYNGGRK